MLLCKQKNQSKGERGAAAVFWGSIFVYFYETLCMLDLGNITADDSGRGIYQHTDIRLKVWNIIGKMFTPPKKGSFCK